MQNNLLALRKRAGLSQEYLAQALGVSQSMISYYEKSRRYYSVDKLVKFCELFNCTPNDVLGFNDFNEKTEEK